MLERKLFCYIPYSQPAFTPELSVLSCGWSLIYSALDKTRQDKTTLFKEGSTVVSVVSSSCIWRQFLTRLTLVTRMSFSRSPFLFDVSTRLRHDDRSLPHNDRASLLHLLRDTEDHLPQAVGCVDDAASRLLSLLSLLTIELHLQGKTISRVLIIICSSL